MRIKNNKIRINWILNPIGYHTTEKNSNVLILTHKLSNEILTFINLFNSLLNTEYVISCVMHATLFPKIQL